MSEEERTRVLTKVIEGCGAIVGDSDNITLGGGEGWHAVLSGAFWCVYNIQTFDLTGYTLQDATLFPQAILMQDMSKGAVGSLSSSAQRATIVSTTPISEDDLTKFDGTTGIWNLPGSLGSTFSLDNIMQGRLQTYFTLTTYAGLQQVSLNTWGSGDSTAASKLWLCDACIIPNIDTTTLETPNQAFVIPSIIDKGPDLEYMMSLSRALEPVY